MSLFIGFSLAQRWNWFWLR